jgi:hypothetical protein
MFYQCFLKKKILLLLMCFLLVPVMASASVLHLTDYQITEGPYPSGSISFSGSCGYAHDVAYGVYIIDLQTTGNLVLQNQQFSPTGSVYMMGGANFSLSFQVLNQDMIPGRTKTLTVRIYTIAGQLVDTESVDISVNEIDSIESGSLALGGSPLANNGVYCVDDSGALLRYYLDGGTWYHETIDTWMLDISPGSLISGNNKVYGVTDSGRAFTTYLSGGQVLFGLLPDPSDIVPGSLALGGTVSNYVGIFGVTTSGNLVRFYWDNNQWNRETINTWGHAIDPDSLISANDRVFGVTTSGAVCNTYMSGGQVAYSLLIGADTISGGSLALGGSPGDNNGVFGVDTSNNLVRFYYANSQWNRETIAAGGYSIHTGSLVSGEDRVFGVTTSGNAFHTYLPGGYAGFSLLPGTANISPTSLAVSGPVDDNVGVFAVDTSSNLVRFAYYYGGGWDRESVDNTGSTIVSGSMIPGDYRVFGVTGAGEIFNGYESGGNGVFELLISSICSTPPYSPAYWNDGGIIQYNNNCYNYSNNKRTDTFAQPGTAAGITLSWPGDMNCTAVGNGATADGLMVCPTAAACPHGRTKIALVIDPQWDYHWYRLDSDGMWSHKPGGTQATNRDNSNNLIYDPETADRGGYITFCGYYCSCSDSQQGQGHENIQ